jgi:hypothetical protein
VSLFDRLQRWVAIIETISDERAETLVAEMRDAIEEMRASSSLPKLIYLATPYTAIGFDPCSLEAMRIEERRYHTAVSITARLFVEGLQVFSPIVHSHEMARVGYMRGDWQAWKAYDERMISLCDELWVATEMTGWDESVGVSAEIEFARSIGKPVVFYEGSK